MRTSHWALLSSGCSGNVLPATGELATPGPTHHLCTWGAGLCGDGNTDHFPGGSPHSLPISPAALVPPLHSEVWIFSPVQAAVPTLTRLV